MRRVLVRLLAAVGLLYLCAVGWLMANETRLVFLPGRPLGPGRPAQPFEQVEIPAAGGTPHFAWLMRASEKSRADDPHPWVLFLHGNDATIASRTNLAHYERLRALGLNVMAPEYRGFAGLAGTPTEPGLAEDARAALTFLQDRERVPARRIIIYGWSLGSAVAVDLASQTEQAAVILEGAPASLVALGQQRYPMFPVALIMRNPFESIRKIDRIRAPLLFLHSARDEIVPVAEGRRLMAAARSPATFVEVAGGHVTASETDPDRFYGAVREFLRPLGLVK